MSELQQMEAPPAYEHTTTAPAYDSTATTKAPESYHTAVTVTTTAPNASGGAQFTSIWDQVAILCVHNN